MSDGPAPLVLTGERTLPGIRHERYWFARHEVAYRYVATLLPPPAGARLTLLDAGCGEGYGAEHLRSTTQARVVALDYDAVSSTHVRRRYPRLAVLRGNLVAVPLRTASVDALVSLQTVEHLWDQPGFAAECARVLRPGGLLAVSTPNRLTFPPGNPFHAGELDADQLAQLLTGCVQDLELLGVHHGPRIAAFEMQHGDVVSAQLQRPQEEWDDELADFVGGLEPEDFRVVPDGAGHPVAASLDLLAVGRRR